jgi:hypothetical protein
VCTDMERWSKVRRLVLAGKLSKRQACEKYKRHWGTLQKILQHEEPPGYRQKQPRAKPVFGPFAAVIHETLTADNHAPAKQRHTATGALLLGAKRKARSQHNSLP